MELFREWIVAVAAAAMLVAAARALSAGGLQGKAAMLTGGLVMLLVTISPLKELKVEDLAGEISRIELNSDFDRTGIEINSTEIMSLIIEEKTEAYILDKAQALGVECSVLVKTEVGENGYPYPHSVTITGAIDKAQEDVLANLIESELAVPLERQEWKKTY